MTHFVYAFTNDAAQLCVHRLQTTDYDMAYMVRTQWIARGYKVTMREEG